jgi:hypothetical protein
MPCDSSIDFFDRLPGITSLGVELEFVCDSMGFVIEPFGFGAFDEVP